MHSEETMSAASKGLLKQSAPPLMGLLAPLHEWIEIRHLEILAEAGYDDVRRAHNAVFIHVPADGIRLTRLAERAGMSKQAMGELVDDLVDKGYFKRAPDPTDGRAKLIVWSSQGLEAHKATMSAFAAIEKELAKVVGATEMTDLKGTLAKLVEDVIAQSDV